MLWVVVQLLCKNTNFDTKNTGMSFAVIINHDLFKKKWLQALHQAAPELPIAAFPDIASPEKVTFLLVWRPPAGVFGRFPNLQCIASAGAGVDHIFRAGPVPENVSITRVVDEQLTRDMGLYLAGQVIAYARDFYTYLRAQQQRQWRPRMYKRTEDLTVGIMGLGVLGIHAAEVLHQLGFKVRGWSRTPKSWPHLQTFAGDEQLPAFLQETHILINLLPLTEQTQGILNKELFAMLPDGAYLINAARGAHLVEEDLLVALDSGKLTGACLDVFCEEPLPDAHPFWQRESIIITPHVASITQPERVAPQIIDNYYRLQKGQPLLHTIDRQRGY